MSDADAAAPGRVQLSNSTKLDRYPQVFAATVSLMEAAGVAAPRILSYGASTGEEAFTLVDRYFPAGTVLGLDVSDEAIAAARATYGGHDRIRFEKGGVFAPEPASFDLIFAMSVLCRWPDTRDMDDIGDLFPFDAFADQVAYLDRLLKPGGILVIYNASYGFLQTRTSRGYDLVLHPRVTKAGFVRRFRRDGRYDPDVVAIDCLYRKRLTDEPLGARGLLIRNQALRRIGLIERDIAF